MTNRNIRNLNASKSIKQRHAVRRLPFLSEVKRLHSMRYPTSRISAEIGKSNGFVLSCLADLGLTPVPHSESIASRSKLVSLRGKERRKSIAKEVERLFNDGYAVKPIADMIGVSRSTINLCLADLGLKKPTLSEGNIRASSKMSKQERKDRAKNAGIALRLSGQAQSSSDRKAVSHQKTGFYIGIGEAQVSEYLDRKGLVNTPQFAWNGYNIDIMVGNLAVEIHNSTSDPIHATQRFVKIIQLLSAGINVIFLRQHKIDIIDEVALSEIVSFHDFTSLNPTPVGQYRVIRGDGKTDISAIRNFNKFAGILAPHCVLNADA